MPDIKLLNAEIDCDDASEHYLRIVVDGKRVKYLCISPGLYDLGDLNFEPALRDLFGNTLPEGDWLHCDIKRDATSDAAVFEPCMEDELDCIAPTWHSRSVEFLDLPETKRRRSNVFEAVLPGSEKAVVVKFARFEWEIGYLEAETMVYEWINGEKIGPEFMGHVTEEGRAMGFMMEAIPDTRQADGRDVEMCQDVVARLHKLNIRHGDLNRHNYLITEERAYLIDFETCTRCDDAEELQREYDSIEKQLNDPSTRGGYGPVEFESLPGGAPTAEES